MRGYILQAIALRGTLFPSPLIWNAEYLMVFKIVFILIFLILSLDVIMADTNAESLRSIMTFVYQRIN